MKESRTFFSLRNIGFSSSYQVLSILINFISRTIFIKYLGVQYLGISALFGNILTVLSIADLGMSTAMVYSLYEPLEKKEKKRVSALITFYGKVYRIIAFTVFLIGLSFMPFIQYMVNTDYEFHSLYLYYFLFLLNTVMSYLFVYKTVILNANQDGYIIKIFSSVFLVIQFIAQLLIIIFTQNFFYYLLAQLISTLLNNMLTAKYTVKQFPYITNKELIDINEKKKIFINIKSLFIYRIGGVILNNTDNILISIIVGTIWVGVYSNYFMIINAILQMIYQAFNAITANIAHLTITTPLKKRIEIFYQLNLISLFLFGLSAFVLFNSCDDFILLWIGESYLLDNGTLLIIIMSFYVAGILNPICLYRDSTGLFKQTKFIMIFTALINLVLSIFLGIQFGLAGILMATMIARLMTNVWFEPYILLNNYFHTSSKKFLQQHICNITAIICSAFIYNCVSYQAITYLSLLFKGILCFIIYIICFLLIYRRSDELNLIKERIKGIFQSSIKEYKR